jgi:hypothetical protein
MKKEQKEKIVKCLNEMHFSGCCDPEASDFKRGQGTLAGDMIDLLTSRTNSLVWESAMRRIRERARNL